MRRAVLLLLLVLALAASGCGGGQNEAATPLDDAVGYFPKDAPAVVAVDTDRSGQQLEQLSKLLGRFPGADVFGLRLLNLSRVRLVDFGRDIEPQLGAPLVIGLVKPATGKDLGAAAILAMRVKHPLRVKQLLLRQPGFRGSAKESGVRVYENPSENRYAAIDGDVVVAGTSRDVLAKALAMRRSDERMRASTFTKDLAGLPAAAFVRASVDPRAMIGADARLRPALNVKWLASMRRMGATLEAQADGITADLRIATDAGSISAGDLPIAPGTRRLQLIGGKNETQVGIAEPDRLVRLALDIWKSISPTRALALKALQPSGVDLSRQLPRHLTGPLTLATNLSNREFALRSGLTRADDVRTALQVLGPALPTLAAFFGFRGLGLATPETGESFYALATPKGWTAVFGVLGNSLVAASDAKRAAGLVSEPTHASASGGGLVFEIDAKSVVTAELAQRLGGPARLFAPLAVRALEDLSGAFTITQDGLRGQARLTIK